MKNLRNFFYVFMMSALSTAAWAQSGTDVKIKYVYFLGEYYLNENSSGELSVSTDNTTTFNLDGIGGGRYLMAVGTPEKSGDYITGRYIFDDTNYLAYFGPQYSPPSDNCYITGNIGTAGPAIVNALRKDQTLYVLGNEQVTDYSILESLVQAGKVKKIDLDQENNFVFYFVHTEVSGTEGYYIDSETDGRIVIDSYNSRAMMWPIAADVRFSMFTFESEQEFIPGESLKSGRFGDNDQLSWTFINNTLEISGNGAIPEYENPNATPWSFYSSVINRIIINNGVTAIGSRAFSHSLFVIKSVSIPESVVNIGTEAFAVENASVIVNWKTAEALPGLGANVFQLGNPNNAILNVPAGTKSIYEAANQWKNFGTVKEREVIVQPELISESKGSFTVSLALPEEGAFTATFDVTLPQKFTLDAATTKLAASLANGYNLDITAKGSGVWSFDIKPKATRSASANDFREILEVAYSVDKSLADGYYELKVQNLTLTLSDGTVIREEEIVIPVIFNSATGSEMIDDNINVWSSGGMLYVRTPAATTLNIYTLTGAWVKRLPVNEGITTISLNNLPQGVYIVKSEDGWTKKVVRH
jgi:hypothetical protein